jgi:hypothetical protein
MIRLMEVLLHGGTTVGGWTAQQIHQAVLTTFELSAKTYGLNQLRYDLRKLKIMASMAVCATIGNAAFPAMMSRSQIVGTASCSLGLRS